MLHLIYMQSHFLWKKQNWKQVLSIIALNMEGEYWILRRTSWDLKRTTVPCAKERDEQAECKVKGRGRYTCSSLRDCVVLMCVRVTEGRAALMGWENNPPLMKQIYRFLVGLEHSVWLEVRCVWECECVCLNQTHKHMTQNTVLTLILHPPL